MENSVNSHITAESHMIASMTGTGQVKKTPGAYYNLHGKFSVTYIPALLILSLITTVM